MDRIGIEYNTRNISLQKHTHDVHEVIFVDSGVLRVAVGSRQMEATPGTLVFFGNQEAHAVTVVKEPYHRFFLTISPGLAKESLHNPQLSSIFRNRPPDFSNVLDVSSDKESIRSFFHQMHQQAAHADTLSRQSMQSLFQLSMAQIYRLRPQAFPMHGRAYSPLVLDVLSYLEAHYTEPLNVAKLAERYYVSASHLTHCFAAQVGCSPKQYIMTSRLALAKDLLISSGLSSSEASARAGFTDVSNFIRRFRAHYGISPSQMKRVEG